MNAISQQLNLRKGELIYILADIHSNLPALEAVLEEIPVGSIIICAGDMLGYYLEPNEVCQLLRMRSALCIQGNHDKYVLGKLNYPATRESKYRILATRKILNDENREWLTSLPDSLSIDVINRSQSEPITTPPTSILVAHGSPLNIEEYIYPDTPIESLAELISGILILGHTHHPMIRQTEALTVVNPGSVGQARDRILGASFCTLDPQTGTVSFYRASYDVAAYQQALKGEGLLPSMVEILSRTRE